MKICIVGHPYISEVNQKKINALKEVSKENEILLISPPSWHIPSFPPVPLFTDNEKIKIVSLPTAFTGHGGLYFFRSLKLISILKSFQPDIIQVDQEPHSLVYLQVLLAKSIVSPKAKLIFFSWNNLPNLRKFPKNISVEMIQGFTLKHTDGAVCGNPDGAQILESIGFKNPIEVIPQFGIESSVYKKDNVEELKKKLKIGSSFVIGYIGRIIPEKGLMTLMETLKELKNYNWKILFVGRGDMMPEILSFGRTYNIEDRIINIDNAFWYDIVPYMNCMDVLVLPSVSTTYWKEQFGRVLIEAMACEVPIIGSDSGAIPWVIGDAGLVFPEENVGKLRTHILNLIQHISLREELAKLGKLRMEREFTEEIVACKYLEFYKRIIDNE